MHAETRWIKRKKCLFLSAALSSILILRAAPALGAHPLLTDDTFTDTPPAYILGGFIYEITKNIDLDVGYKHGFNKPAMDYSISGP